MTTTENTQPATFDNNKPPVDPISYLGMIFNADGTITRKDEPLQTPTTFDFTLPPVFTQDITINQSNNTGARIYVHRKALESTTTTELLPVIVYVHGGGFVVGRASSPIFHYFCSLMAVEIPALIVSVDYRLAPEHRLPAAYHDCVEVLQWIKNSPHELLTKYGDLSNCYIMGGSAGGNIAYHAPAFLKDVDLNPVIIKGLVLFQPFFGGTKRTESELRHVNDLVLPLTVSDVMWDLGLPDGVDRDHEYCNPTVETELRVCDWIKKLGLRVMVKGCDGDPLVDRQVELVKMMNEKDIEVVSSFDEGNFHGIDLFDPSYALSLCLVIKDFIFSAQSTLDVEDEDDK
ncbi:Alpha/beta hydrolase-3 [Heracleum sosnowskyi]|uniref:Alpha/beta hydrolase-3 n=1 Tax=Heracleum sosnowskyi TaxID=360622 RepID=A0AAD8H266_9APIA|nr:Alpha/beta hydrolase-3 [Heracleum sosnowskyi]